MGRERNYSWLACYLSCLSWQPVQQMVQLRYNSRLQQTLYRLFFCWNYPLFVLGHYYRSGDYPLHTLIRTRYCRSFQTQMVASRKCKAQPRIKALREQYPVVIWKVEPSCDQEMRKVYKELGSNIHPLWPILIQMPVLFGTLSSLESSRLLKTGHFYGLIWGGVDGLSFRFWRQSLPSWVAGYRIKLCPGKSGATTGWCMVCLYWSLFFAISGPQVV